MRPDPRKTFSKSQRREHVRRQHTKVDFPHTSDRRRGVKLLSPREVLVRLLARGQVNDPRN